MDNNQPGMMRIRGFGMWRGPVRRRPKQQATYYSVFAVKDGTVWLASTKRKPGGLRPDDIDEDGVFNTFVDKLGEEDHYNQTAKLLRGSTLATCLNFKLVLRTRVEARLAALDEQVAELRTQADRIETLLQQLVDRAGGTLQPGPEAASAPVVSAE